jgi:hypothetical protein
MTLFNKGKRLAKLERLHAAAGARRPPAFLRMPDGRTFQELTDEELAAELGRMQEQVAANRRDRPAGSDPEMEAWARSLSDEELEAEVARAERAASRG